MKIIRCPNCGSDNIEYNENGGWRQQSIDVDPEGNIIYGEVTAGEVDESYFECNNCQHREYNEEAIVQDVKIGESAELIETLINVMCKRCPHFKGACMPDMLDFKTPQDYLDSKPNYKQLNVCVLYFSNREHDIYPREDELEFPATDVYNLREEARA